MKSVSVAIAAEALITAIVAIGIYYGVGVFPYTTPWASGTTPPEPAQLHFTLPIGMPSLQELKMPLSFIRAEGLGFGIAGFLLSAAAILAQSFARGAYLGGLRSHAVNGEKADMLRAGRHFFFRMTGWTIFQHAAGLILFFSAVVFFPFALIGMIVLFAFSLTPYVIVLRDVGLAEGLASAPGVFRRAFGRLLPLAIVAAIVTALCGGARLAPVPYNYLLCMVIYVPAATYLIYELMLRLHAFLRENNTPLPKPQFRERARRFGGWAWAALLLVAPLTGAAAATGHLFAPLSLANGSEKEWNGVSFWNDFTAAYARSEQRYTTYGWKHTGEMRLRISMPELANGAGPELLRGTAEVTWGLMEEKTTRSGNSSHIFLEETQRTDRLFYSLKKATTSTGASYFSSREGTAHLLTSGGNLREPHELEMMVSGDGKRVFLLLHPTRFPVDPVWRVSKDGRYLIPLTSPMNAGDFRYFWFSSEPKAEEAFAMLAEKNKETLLGAPAPYQLLPYALQEADGDMVATLIAMTPEAARESVPAWDAEQWTSYLRTKYEGVEYAELFPYVSKAGEYDGHVWEERTPKSEGAIRTRITVPYPNGSVTVEFEEKEGQLLELQLFLDGIVQLEESNKKG
ncbi:hypothetical protein FE782_18400 [Paenibacillus antri]|uniref:Uncharacterized protein n=1 Tax=Paenibacillus antri TaxID=2582848 RepID=A0A5R9G8J4_9BACL|nr:hypothetical protein [Paenibacillus antri]TLS50676.1 hypothetical protein FE782_18400 [Paenibacillus antri]